MGKLVVGPVEALRLIQIRYRDYVEAEVRWQACAAAIADMHLVGAAHSGFPAWAESQQKLNRLLDLLKDLALPPEGAPGIAPEASKDSAGHP